MADMSQDKDREVKTNPYYKAAHTAMRRNSEKRARFRWGYLLPGIGGAILNYSGPGSILGCLFILWVFTLTTWSISQGIQGWVHWHRRGRYKPSDWMRMQEASKQRIEK